MWMKMLSAAGDGSHAHTYTAKHFGALAQLNKYFCMIIVRLIRVLGCPARHTVQKRTECGPLTKRTQRAHTRRKDTRAVPNVPNISAHTHNLLRGIVVVRQPSSRAHSNGSRHFPPKVFHNKIKICMKI